MSKQVVHADSGKTHIMPISGIHVITTCGKWFQKNHQPNDSRYTVITKNVTCKRCLKLLEESKTKYNK